MFNNKSLCFTKGMGEIKQYCMCSRALDSKAQKVYTTWWDMHSFSPWTKSCVELKQGLFALAFCARRDQNRKKLKLIHLNLRLTVLRLYKDTSPSTASVTACGIYSNSTRCTLQQISSNFLNRDMSGAYLDYSIKVKRGDVCLAHMTVFFIPEDDWIQQSNARSRGIYLWALLPVIYMMIFLV